MDQAGCVALFEIEEPAAGCGHIAHRNNDGLLLLRFFDGVPDSVRGVSRSARTINAQDDSLDRVIPARIVKSFDDCFRTDLRLSAIETAHISQHVEQKVGFDLRLEQCQLLFSLVMPQLRTRHFGRVRSRIDLQCASVSVGDQYEEHGWQTKTEGIGQHAR